MVNEICDDSIPDKDIWKTQTLIDMQKFEDELNNKIKGLNCILEIVNNYKEFEPVIKQIEDIIDTIFVNISHIDNFKKFINDMPISNLIKRKNIILNTKINVLVDIPNEIKMIDIKGVIKIILNNGADIHANGEYVLQHSSYEGYLDIVECLIKYGADIHADNDYALSLASCNGKIDVVKCLLSHGADIHASNDSALIDASGNGYLDIVKILIKYAANIHANNDDALCDASRNGHLDIVKYLIEQGQIFMRMMIMLLHMLLNMVN
jgi:hypothetical protein